jgi:hypothetical protein
VKWGGTYRVEVFLFEVTAELTDWPEQHVRQHRWFPLAHAAEIVAEPALRDLLERAAARLGR